MVDQPTLARAGSVVPVSTHNCESAVLPVECNKAWEVFKAFKLEKVVPGHIVSTEFISGAPGQLDSIIKITYADKAVWEIRVNEISDIRHSFGYDIISTEPAHMATSIQGMI